METAAIVVEHKFDKEMLKELETLRSIQLHTAEKMLFDLDQTATELKQRGLLGDEPDLDMDELRNELESRVAMLRGRVEGPEVIYADEISFYVSMLGSEME